MTVVCSVANTTERYDVIDLSALPISVGLSNPGGFAIVGEICLHA